uniref:Putative tetraspanin n=1 Tax=Ixodes ricinus TaxID=34613 RepID=A0A0K8RCS8_IXORI
MAPYGEEVERYGNRMPVRKHRRDKSEISCCLKYLIFGFNVIFWTALEGTSGVPSDGTVDTYIYYLLALCVAGVTSLSTNPTFFGHSVKFGNNHTFSLLVKHF